MSGDHHIRQSACRLPYLQGEFITECFYTQYGKGRIQGRIEVAGFLQNLQENIEQLGPHRQPDHLRSVGFTGTCLFGDFRLGDALAVESLLYDDAAQAGLGGL